LHAHDFGANLTISCIEEASAAFAKDEVSATLLAETGENMISKALGGALLSAAASVPVHAAPVTLAKPGAYTLSADVVTASSPACPYDVAANTEKLAGYTAFIGFSTSGPNISFKQSWVIAISPANPELTKYGYTLNKATAVSGTTVTFKGSAVFGGPSTEFSGSQGTYRLVVNPTTLAATLTVTDTKCVITYNLKFDRSIPAKFLNLL